MTLRQNDDHAACVSLSNIVGDAALLDLACDPDCRPGRPFELAKMAWATKGRETRKALKSKAMDAFEAEGQVLVPLWLNDLTAHRQNLIMPTSMHADPERVIAYGWFK